MNLTPQHPRLTCREVEDFIIDYLEGRLASDERLRFESHLETCVACTTYLAAYRVTVELGKKAFAHADPGAGGDVPEELVEAILKARDAHE